MEQIEVIEQENSEKEYVFNEFPFDDLSDIIEELKNLTDKINEDTKNILQIRKET